MRSLINSIVKKHRKGDGIEINCPVYFSEIEDFEEEMDFDLPTDFKEFYLISDGFHCTEDEFNMIPLSKIRQYPQDYGENWFYFSEYMDYSDMWGLRYTHSGQYEIFNGSYPEKTMTSSLTEFLKKFLDGNVFDNGGLYKWQEEIGIK